MALTVGSQVRVAYDFDGEESNEELTVKEGDILTIRFTDVGEGWIQARVPFLENFKKVRKLSVLISVKG